MADNVLSVADRRADARVRRDTVAVIIKESCRGKAFLEKEDLDSEDDIKV